MVEAICQKVALIELVCIIQSIVCATSKLLSLLLVEQSLSTHWPRNTIIVRLFLLLEDSWLLDSPICEIPAT